MKLGEGVENKRHKIKAQNAAHLLIEHYTYNSLCTYLLIYTRHLREAPTIKLMTTTADLKYAAFIHAKLQ